METKLELSPHITLLWSKLRNIHNVCSAGEICWQQFDTAVKSQPISSCISQQETGDKFQQFSRLPATRMMSSTDHTQHIYVRR